MEERLAIAAENRAKILQQKGFVNASARLDAAALRLKARAGSGGST
jgi:hypothetical protein